MSGQRRVIVGISGSPGSLPAVRQAERIARRDEAQLIAVHAWTAPGGDRAERGHPSAYLRRIWQKDAEDRLQQALAAVWAREPEDLAVERWVVRGETGPALVGLANEPDDMLVVGAGRRGRLGRARHGRISRYCLARAGCPVLAVPPPALAAAAPRGVRAWSFRHHELTVEQALAEWQSDRLNH